MTPTAILLAAALGAGQLFPDQPTLGGPCPACPPCVPASKVATADPCFPKPLAEAKGLNGVAKPAPAATRTAPVPRIARARRPPTPITPSG